jgi:hypothetical protein
MPFLYFDICFLLFTFCFLLFDFCKDQTSSHVGQFSQRTIENLQKQPFFDSFMNSLSARENNKNKNGILYFYKSPNPLSNTPCMLLSQKLYQQPKFSNNLLYIPAAQTKKK